MMMRAAVVPSSPLLLHLLTQARTITSFAPPVTIARPQICSSINRHVSTTSSLFDMMKNPTSCSSTAASTPLTSTTLGSVAAGGDHAGLSATFSSKTGELIPVPEHLVPESMIEWGEIPSYFEILVSEDLLEENEEKKTKMERTTITVLPEVGCGIDNLETTKKVEEFNLHTNESRHVKWKDGKEQDVLVLDRKVGPSTAPDQLVYVETMFQVASEVVTDDQDAAATDNEDREQVYPRRIRVTFTIDTTSNHIIKDTITINIERLYSTTSTKGTRWSGPQHNSGGLDARSVMNTIGKDIVYGDVFGVKRLKSGEDVWMMDDAVKRIVIEGTEDDDSIRLPQNILVQFHNKESSQSWGIELSHFDVSGSKMYRRSVLRAFDSSEDGFGSVTYREEEKTLENDYND
ncbi:hypothetical protein QTG54_004997 [Skeletonema marinoi]|uniref:Uncharacterized protein n=1 Tax=Skeletonema marinoi TaxID=267567 RepID=A0AAD9DFN6_9STRA|nr:hypothetical protein QTG54_004997 [Skeletonema marinoi]